MSEIDIDQQFRDIADSFINLANEKSESIQPENIGLAMLFAVSRFNAHVVALNSDNLESYAKNIELSKDFFIEKYKGMLEENLADYKKVFKPAEKYSHLMKE